MSSSETSTVKVMLLIDGVRYHLHRYRGEGEFEGVVEEHVKDIFGVESIYFGGKKVSSLSGICSLPDGYAITFWNTPRWYVVEIELSTHPLFEHIVSQINKFIAGIEGEQTKRRLIDYMYEEVNSQPLLQHSIKEKFGEVHKFLSDLIHKPPTFLIVVDEKTKELDDAVKRIPAETKVIEFKTFEREGVGLAVHAHLFEPPSISPTPTKPVTPPIRVKPGESTPQREYRIPILEALIEMGGSGSKREILKKVFEKMKGKLKPKDLEYLKGGSVRWVNAAEGERWELKTKGFLRSGSPRGIWEITDKGRKHYEELKQNN